MRVVWTGYGAAAYEALRGVVGEVKGGDALAPVSVLVPTHLWCDRPAGSGPRGRRAGGCGGVVGADGGSPG
jgi:hypothetical protein